MVDITTRAWGWVSVRRKGPELFGRCTALQTRLTFQRTGYTRDGVVLQHGTAQYIRLTTVSPPSHSGLQIVLGEAAQFVAQVFIMVAGGCAPWRCCSTRFALVVSASSVGEWESWRNYWRTPVACTSVCSCPSRTSLSRQKCGLLSPCFRNRRQVVAGTCRGDVGECVVCLSARAYGLGARGQFRSVCPATLADAAPAQHLGSTAYTALARPRRRRRERARSCGRTDRIGRPRSAVIASRRSISAAAPGSGCADVSRSGATVRAAHAVHRRAARELGRAAHR